METADRTTDTPEPPAQKKSTSKGVTGKMRRFAEIYGRIGNGTQAAIQAGYAKSAAAKTSSRLLRHPGVQELIVAKNIQRDVHAEETYRQMIELGDVAMEHVREIKRRLYEPKESEKACSPEELTEAIDAASRHLERLAKAEGLYLPGVEGGGNTTFNLQVLIARYVEVHQAKVEIPAPKPGAIEPGTNGRWSSMKEG